MVGIMVVISNNIIRRKYPVEIPVESTFERVWEQMELLMSEETLKRFLQNNIKNKFFNLNLDPVLIAREECKSKIGKPIKFISNDDIDNVSKTCLLSIKQAKEYFKASKNVSPMTKPVLLYYGMVNFAKTLINSTYHVENDNNTGGHGLSVDKKSFEILIYKEGEYQTFRDCFIGDPRLYAREHPLKIDLKDLLSVIPSLRLSWVLAYKNINSLFENLNNPRVTGYNFKSSYISAETCLKTSSGDFNVYYGMGNEDIDKPEYAINLGTRAINYTDATYFIEIPKFVHLIDVYYLAMFILCDYARYRPSSWSEFLNKDNNLFLIKNFLRRAELDFPMLIYSELTGMKTYFEKLG